MKKIEDIINTNFNQTQTDFKDLDFKQLVLMLESFKNDVNKCYDVSTKTFTDEKLIENCRDVIQEIHNRICEHYNIKPTIVNVFPNDLYLSENGKNIEGGKYSFENRDININLLANFNQENYETYMFNNLSMAWGAYHLRNIFHETYHHIQMENLKAYIFNQDIPNHMQNQIKMLKIYFEYHKDYNNPIIDYQLSPIELPARQFAQNSIDYLISQNILENSKENDLYNKYCILNEFEKLGKKYNYLFLSSEELWKNAVGNNEEEIKTIEEFFYETILYYKQLEITKENTVQNLCNNFFEYKDYINKFQVDSIGILALNYDYEKYKKHKNPERFLAQTQQNNVEVYRSGFSNRCSRLPHFIQNTQKAIDNELHNN